MGTELGRPSTALAGSHVLARPFLISFSCFNLPENTFLGVEI
jgi:hypothetical protein